MNLEEKVKLLQQLKGGLYNQLSINELKDIISNLIKDDNYPWPIFTFHTTDDNYNIVYRGRIDNDNDKFDQIGEYSYVPKEYVSSYGRCNGINESIFYGANNIDTVFSELSPDIDDIVHISSYSMKEDINISAIGQIDQARRYNKTIFGDEKYVDIFKSDPKYTEFAIIDAYLADFFSKPAFNKNDYKLSIAITKYLLGLLFMQKKENTSEVIIPGTSDWEYIITDGFVYPSVKHQGGINFALKPYPIDNKFIPIECKTLKIKQNFGYGIYAYETLKTSKSIDSQGNIFWE